MATKKKHPQAHFLKGAALLTSLLVVSCSIFEKKSAVLWTDTPEMLIAVELYNSSHSRRALELRYVEELSGIEPERPGRRETAPSLLIGKGLRHSSLADYFQPLDYLFSKLGLPKQALYPRLLEGGLRNGRQNLVPISFNTLLVLSKKQEARAAETETLSGTAGAGNAIGMEEIRRRAVIFNNSAGKNKSALGFSPRWPDQDFLFQWLQLQGAAFREAKPADTKKSSRGEALPLTWDAESLERGANALRAYIREVNGSAAEEDAIAFKYLFAPGYKNVAEGKTLFAAINSADYFTLPAALRSKYDHRYFAENEKLAVLESIKYAGIPRRAPDKEAAEQFLRWFLDAGNQKAILEKSRALRLSESAFGIAGGFSSLQAVTETLFPFYYGDLLGQSPPAAMVFPPQPMPPFWGRMKTELILPWLDETAGEELGRKADAELFARLEAYMDKNPDLR